MLKFILRIIFCAVWTIVGAYGLMIALAMILSGEYRKESTERMKNEWEKWKNRHYTKLDLEDY